MPHLPDSAHESHDLERIAAFAAGDATGEALDTATALVAACPDCAALNDDLRSIMAVMPTLPTPRRTRDFRLTPEQAASARPRGLRGVLATLASPRFSFAGPLGTGLAALGVIGVLVATGGVPAGGGTSAAVADQSVSGAEAAPENMTLADPSAAPAAPSGDPALAFKPAAEDGTAAAGTQATRQAGVSATAAPNPLLVAGVLLVLVGLGLIGARLVARQVARAP